MIRVSCPICGRAMVGETSAQWPQFPFCSPRCRLIDLGRWLGEEYRIAGGAAEAEAAEDAENIP